MGRDLGASESRHCGAQPDSHRARRGKSGGRVQRGFPHGKQKSRQFFQGEYHDGSFAVELNFKDGAPTPESGSTLQIQTGDVLQISGPRGNFVLERNFAFGNLVLPCTEGNPLHVNAENALWHGTVALRANDPKDGVCWASFSADRGNAEAMIIRGLALYNGWGVVKVDKAEAAKWFEQEAKGGDYQATQFLARMYSQGHGVPLSVSQANAALDLGFREHRVFVYCWLRADRTGQLLTSPFKRSRFPFLASGGIQWAAGRASPGGEGTTYLDGDVLGTFPREP